MYIQEKQEEKKDFPLKRYLILGILAIVLAYAIATNGFLVKPIAAIPVPTPSIINDNTTPIEIEQSGDFQPHALEPELVAQRRNYGIDMKMFDNLPYPPVDFFARKEQFETKRLSLSYLSKDYWLQPEFFQNFEGGLAMMKNYPSDRVARSGYGTYPAEQIAELPENQSGILDVEFLVKASWGVVSYQGFKIYPVIPETAQLQLSTFPDGTKDVAQDVDLVNSRISASYAPEQFVIEPSYSRWEIKDFQNQSIFTVKEPQFEAGWVKLVKASISIRGLPKGKYAIGFNLESPDAKFNGDMTWKYSRLYEQGGGFNPGRPWYTLFLYVN